MKKIFCLCLCLLLTACGSSKKASDSTSELEGVWTSDCTLDTTDNDYQATTMTLTGTKGIMSAYDYSDKKCKTKINLLELSFSFTIGEQVDEPANAKEFDMKDLGASLTFYNKTTLNEFNAAKVCGGGYTLNKTKVLTAAACKGSDFADFFDPSYTVYKLSGEKLYLGLPGDKGSDTDASTAGKRPTELDDSALVRQASI